MGAAGRFISVVGWVISLLLQAGVGLILGFLLAFSSRQPWAVTVVLFGIGAALGSFGVGSAAIALRRSIVPRRYLARAASAVAGAVIPLAVLIAIGLSVGTDSPAVEDRWGPLLSALAIIASVAGFHVPGLARARVPAAKPAEVAPKAA